MYFLSGMHYLSEFSMSVYIIVLFMIPSHVMSYQAKDVETMYSTDISRILCHCCYQLELRSCVVSIVMFGMACLDHLGVMILAKLKCHKADIREL